MKQLHKTLRAPTTNNFGIQIPTGTGVTAEYEHDGSDLVRCVSSVYGVFYTAFHNLH